jgi:preprotein translocase subunit SecD
MVTWRACFNSILAIVLTVALVLTGCKTPTPEEKMQSLVRIHLEVNRDSREMGVSKTITIFRSQPTTMHVMNMPFLAETELEKAEVINTLGGFALSLKFTPTGGRVIEQISATNPGKRFAIYIQFGEKLTDTNTMQGRWLAAPKVNGRISDGMMIFTPDCSREEADKIVLGLNNVVVKQRKKNLLQ